MKKRHRKNRREAYKKLRSWIIMAEEILMMDLALGGNSERYQEATELLSQIDHTFEDHKRDFREAIRAAKDAVARRSTTTSELIQHTCMLSNFSYRLA